MKDIEMVIPADKELVKMIIEYQHTKSIKTATDLANKLYKICQE